MPKSNASRHRDGAAQSSTAGDFVIPEDVKTVAVPALAHRLALDTKAKYSGLQKDDVVREILDSVPVGV